LTVTHSRVLPSVLSAMRPGYAALPSGMPKVERRIQGVPEGSAAYPGQGVVTRSEHSLTTL